MVKDTLFSVPMNPVPFFTFDHQVAEVFDDMISRSTPLYHSLQTLIARICVHLHRKNYAIYDLGCSTGQTLFTISKLCPDAQLIGVDSSADMIRKAQQKCSGLDNISLITDDICNVPIENADTILLPYSLQFVPTKKRLPLLQRIFNALPPHGTLLLSEKILSPNHPELFSSLHTDYKLAQDYSALEIRQKRDALENVLIPKTLSENINLLSSAGFTQIETIFQYVNFVTILGRKEN